MRAAFFTDHRFARDASGRHYSYGGLPYAALARYLRHFDEVVVVGRVAPASGAPVSLSSGPGVEMRCVEGLQPLALLGPAVRQHVRDVLRDVDCAIVRVPSFIADAVRSETEGSGRPWLAEVVGCPWDSLWNHGTWTGKIAAAPMFLLTRLQVRSAPFALYVTEEFLQRRYPCPGPTVACSDVAITEPAPEVLQARLDRIRALDRRDRVVLGLLGSLDVEYKGHETALRALALVRRSIPRVVLRLLGSGDTTRWQKRAAELGVADHVEFTGSLPHGAPVLAWMDALDLFLIPSLQEGLPRALVEAMSRALPAVGARTGGIPELLNEGFLHAPGDHGALATLVDRLVRSAAAMETAARENWATAARYGAPILDARREAFFERFKEFARSRAGPARAGARQSGMSDGDWNSSDHAVPSQKTSSTR